MERRVSGGEAQSGAAAGTGAGYTGAQDAAARGLKHDSGAARIAAGQSAMAEENWSALSNLRVAGETESGEEAAGQTQTQPGSIRPSAGSSSRHKVRRTSSQVHPTTPLDDEAMLHDLDAVSKSSLSFILDDQAASAAAGDDFTSGGKRAAALITRSRSTGDLTGETPPGAASGRCARAGGKQGADGKRRARRPPSRICKHEGCEQYVVDQGLCVRHGGGKRCSTEGCTSRAKHQGRCWRHGGSTECKVPSCINRAKSRGFCWSHGGGTKCKFDDCEKIAISNGLCWAHGGGKRCAVEGCMRQAYERTDNLCNNHYQERQQGATIVTEESGETVAASSLPTDDEDKPPAPPSDH